MSPNEITIIIEEVTPQLILTEEQGPEGVQGPVGPQGAQGPTGPAGTTDYNLITNLPDLTLKADKSTTYTKLEVDASLAGKAQAIHVHTISDVTGLQTALDGKSATGHTHADLHTHANKAVLDATTASFTTADELKLDGLEAGAQVNAVTSVAGKTGAVTLTPDDLDDTATTHKFVAAGDLTKLSRTITGTTNQVTVTNGDGVSGNPTLSLPQSIHTGASPTFNTVTASLTGAASLNVLKAGDTMSGTLNTFTLTPVTNATYTLGDSSHYYSTVYTQAISGLTTPLSIDQGGTGSATQNFIYQYIMDGITITRDYNAQVTNGSGYYIADGASAISNGPSAAWFSTTLTSVNGGFFGQLVVTNQSTYFRGGNTADVATTAWVALAKVSSTDSLTPSITANYNLGSASLYWGRVYAGRYYGNSTAYIDAATAGTFHVTGKFGIGVAPTAILHLKAAAAAANTASLKIDAGTVATTPVSGNIESDGTHLYWTDSGGTRRQLDN